jgi:hypothetical protein
MFWFLSALVALFWEFCEGVCRLMSAKSGFSRVMGLMLVGSAVRLAVGGSGLSPLGSEFRLVGMGLTSEDSRQEVATRAMATSGSSTSLAHRRPHDRRHRVHSSPVHQIADSWVSEPFTDLHLTFVRVVSSGARISRWR